MINIVTHDGKFHPDEIYACVLLHFFTGDELKFTRTRDERIIKKAQNDIYTYVVDVGGLYEPSKNNLDHHQSTFTDVGTNGDVLSSCGLMWRKLRDTLDVSDFIKSKVDEFTIKVDRHDNGVEYFNEVEFVSLYNYNDVKGTTQKTRFKRAYAVALTHFKNMMNMWTEIERKEIIAKDVLKNASYNIIYSDEYIGVSPTLNQSDNLLLVSPRNESEYTISSLNVGIDVDFSIRCPAPEDWRGLSGNELDEKSGFKDMVFCHKSGFITIVKGDKDSALAVAKKIIESNKE